jgi:outer membrane protein OmpA-like peptidoglycan-associated protein
MNNNPNIKLNVIGNADNIGTSTYNQKLALNRANEIINFLSRNFNIDKNRFTAISNGEEKPLAEEKVSVEFPVITLSEINRRVDFQIIR